MIASLLLSSLLVLAAPSSSSRADAIHTMNEGVKLAHQGNKAGAYRKITEALEIDPSYDAAWLNLGVLHQSRGELDEAKQAFEKGLGVGEGKVAVELRFRLGSIVRELAREPGLGHQERVEHIERARAHFEAVTKAEPERARAHLGLARCHDDLDRPKEADAAYRKAIEADPRLSEAYTGLARMYVDYGHERPAMAILKVNVEVNPLSVDAWMGLGNGHMAREEYEEAIVAFEKVRAIDPDRPDMYYQLGLARADLDHRREAIEALERFLSLAGRDVPEYLKVHARSTITRLQDVR